VSAFVRGMAILAICSLVSSSVHRPVPHAPGSRSSPKTARSFWTLEFSEDIQSSIIILPRRKSMSGPLRRQFDGPTKVVQLGQRWKSKYGAVGTNGFKFCCNGYFGPAPTFYACVKLLPSRAI
jgi:hypothetical protein